MNLRIVSTLVACSLTAMLSAQVSSTLSPYSQFGLGALADQSQGFNRGMGGVGIGLRGGQTVNFKNPASYSATDSLTMLFDVGASLQTTNFKEGGKRINANTGSFDYAVVMFRLLPKVGVSLGIVPFSNVGYKYSVTESVNGSSTNYSTLSYNGSGGLSQGYVGVGWEFFSGLSAGVNFSYLWGSFERTAQVVNSDAYVNTETQTYQTTISSYKLDLGLQWRKQLNADNTLTVGATVGIGHNLGNQADCVRTNSNSQTAVSETHTDSVADAMSLPTTLGVGVTLVHRNSLTVGFDYEYQRWGTLDYPHLDTRTSGYTLQSGLLKDRHVVRAGADWVPNPMNRRLYNRIHYRAGISYATPYFNVGSSDGPRELTIGAGFGIPLTNSWNNRSLLNVSAQWVNQARSGLITENGFRINIGLTFNERWFAKWKVD